MNEENSPKLDISMLETKYRDGLLGDTLKFWFPRSLDAEHGGFLHCLDRDGSVIDMDKSVWAQGRMSWLLFELYNQVEKRPEWLAWGKSGLDFIERHGFDSDGRMFFHVTREGLPIRKRRYAYSESFASIAYAAHAKAENSDRSASKAMDLFDRFIEWNFTPGLMPSKFTDVRPLIGMGPRMIAIVTAQELRKNLGDDPRLKLWIDRCIEEIERYFVKSDIRCVMETVAPNGDIPDHFDSRLLNPGHAIEGAWFIMREGIFRKDGQLVKLACKMLDWMWERGWDKDCGGILYFQDVKGKAIQEYWHDMKFWWPQNETMIATLMAHIATGDPKYAEMHMKIHNWAYSLFPDPVCGEWFGYLHRDGRVSSPLKGNMWKSCFHHPRMQLICWQLCKEMKDQMSETP